MALGNVFRQRPAAYAANLACCGRLLDTLGLDGVAHLLPGPEASLQSECAKAPVSQHQRRTGAGFFVESRAVGDDRGRPWQFLETVSEFFGSHADRTCDSLTHLRVDARRDNVQDDGLPALDQGSALFGCDSKVGIGRAQLSCRTGQQVRCTTATACTGYLMPGLDIRTGSPSTSSPGGELESRERRRLSVRPLRDQRGARPEWCQWPCR